MANTNSTYRIGSSGDGVKELQEKLIAEGYDVGKTGADGVYGKNTANAVKQYQEKNGLTVDGIAGKNTLGALYGTTASGDQSNTTTDTNAPATGGGFQYDNFTYDDYAPSDIVNEANNVLQQQEASKPGEYAPVWQDEADSYLSQYQNRDPFSYDFNSDALYQQYKDMYIQQGQMAMMDTMGQASAMTGGYGNSYAQTAGQQAYNQYLNQLNAIIPELNQMAYDRYTQEGQELLQMYDLYMNRENTEYGRYQDKLSNWYTETARLQDKYDTLSDRDYNMYMDGKNYAYNDYQTGRSEAYDEYQKNIDREYQKERDAVSDEQWQKTYDLQKKASRGTSGNTTVKYADFDYEEQQKWKKNFEEAVTSGNLTKLENVANDMEAAGIDPKIVGEWLDRYAGVLTTGKTTGGGIAGALGGLANWIENTFK